MAVTYKATVGGAIVKTGTGGAAALETLGIPEDGVQVEISKHDLPVKTDVAGDAVPAELQEMGMDAVIRMTLVAWDNAVALKLEKAASESTEGTQPAMGIFMGGVGQPAAFRLLIDSTTDDPFNFITAKIRRYRERKSSKHNKLELEFYAWTYLAPTVTSATGVKLYDRVRT